MPFFLKFDKNERKTENSCYDFRCIRLAVYIKILFLLEKRTKLSHKHSHKWLKNEISQNVVGRTTLAKSVVASIANHVML